MEFTSLLKNSKKGYKYTSGGQTNINRILSVNALNQIVLKIQDINHYGPPRIAEKFNSPMCDEDVASLMRRANSYQICNDHESPVFWSNDDCAKCPHCSVYNIIKKSETMSDNIKTCDLCSDSCATVYTGDKKKCRMECCSKNLCNGCVSSIVKSTGRQSYDFLQMTYNCPFCRSENIKVI